MRSWHRGPTSTCSEKHQLDAQKNRNNQKKLKKSSSQSIPKPFFYRCFTQRMTTAVSKGGRVAKPQELTKAFVALGGDVQLMTNVCPRSSQRKRRCFVWFGEMVADGGGNRFVWRKCKGIFGWKFGKRYEVVGIFGEGMNGDDEIVRLRWEKKPGLIGNYLPNDFCCKYVACKVLENLISLDGNPLYLPFAHRVGLVTYRGGCWTHVALGTPRKNL